MSTRVGILSTNGRPLPGYARIAPGAAGMYPPLHNSCARSDTIPAVAQHPIELILIKQWAGYLTVPVFVMDAGANLVYYNEPAEALLGRNFDDVGEIAIAELATIFSTTAVDGSPMPSEHLPIGIALMQHRPAHGRLRFTALDGIPRLIEATAFPIEGQGGNFLGAVAMFWESPS